MDKKTGIVLGVICAIMVALIAVVFVMDSKTENMDKNTILVVDDVKYTTDEFEKFALISNYENGDITKVMTSDETVTMLDNFLLKKIYYKAATEKGIVLESGDTSTFDSDYASNEATLLRANITKDDYIKYKTEAKLVEKLQLNFDDHYELPDKVYSDVKDAYIKEDMYKTYGFRLMTIPYEEPESGDVSGDTSGDSTDVLASGDVSGDKEDLSRDVQLAVAEDVLARIKSGESFEDLANEYGSTRLSFKGNEYVLVNGDIEYATTPLLESKLNSEDLYNAVLKMNSGDISAVIEDEDYKTFQIVKVESVEEGFVGEGEKELKSILLSEYANDIVASNVHYDLNQSAYARLIYKK